MTAKCQEIIIDLEIKNNLGLHARPAAMFVQTAATFISDISVEKDGECVNGKSLMGLLMLAAGKGTIIKVTVRGEDSDKASAALEDLINRKFDED